MSCLCNVDWYVNNVARDVVFTAPDPCNDTCTEWERCVEDDTSSLALANLPGPFPMCVLTNGK